MSQEVRLYQHHLKSVIQRLFPPGVAIAIADTSQPCAPLFDVESKAIINATDQRRSHFAAGRQCAREALASLGIAASAIPVGPDRAPQWPEGIVGSITHSDDFVAAVAAHVGELRGVGIDAESITRQTPAKLFDRICTVAERARTPSELSEQLLPLLYFSAKESVYKAVAPAAGMYLHFQDVELDFDVAQSRFRATLVRTPDPRLPDFALLSGRFVIEDGLIITTSSLQNPG